MLPFILKITLSCVQNITLDYECRNISEISVQVEPGCRLQFVAPSEHHDLLCTKLLTTDIRHLDQAISASNLKDVTIKIHIRSTLPITNLNEINVFRFEKEETITMQNVTLELDISHTQDTDGAFLQAYRFNTKNEEDLNALVLKRFKIDTFDKCQYTVQDFVKINDQEAVAFKDENMNDSSICLDFGSGQLKKSQRISMFTPRPFYENIRIVGNVAAPDQTFSALSHSQWAGSTVVERCFLQLNVTGFVFAGLFSSVSNPLNVQKMFLRAETHCSHSYGIVQSSVAPVFVSTALLLVDMISSAQTAFVLGKSRSSLVLELVTIQAKVEAPVFASALGVRFMHLQRCTIVLQEAIGDGGLLLFDTRIFEPTHVLVVDCQLEAQRLMGKVGLVYRLRSRSVLELTGSAGGGCPSVVQGSGDVFGSWVQ